MRSPLRRMAFRLALARGEIDVDAMLANTPLPLLYEWMIYAESDMLIQDRIDYWGSLLMAFLANALRGKGSHRSKPEDFLPTRDEPKAPQTAATIKATLMQIKAVHDQYKGSHA